LLDELGKRFEVENVAVKLYPSCLATHGAIYGALELSREHVINPADVEKVIVTTSKFAHALCGLGDDKVAPQAIADAQFSYYYTVANALLKGKVFLDDFTEEAIRDKAVLALARKVEVVVDEEKDKCPGLVIPVDIEIRMKDGNDYQRSVVYVKGHPSNPLSLEECAQKLRDCAHFSLKPVPEERVEHVIELVKRLETLPDATEVISPLLEL
jgi:2-methylcitrate dehydratase PrpD